MKHEFAFDPESGAPLSDEHDYHPDHGVPVRTPVQHHTSQWTASREGALTNGELRSSGDGLIGYFRHKHREVRAPDNRLDQAAALGIRKLKSAEDNKFALDCFLWYALAEKLAKKGHWVAWMLDFAGARCPKCHSRLKFRPAIDKLEGVCASSEHDHGAVDDDIRSTVRRLYERAFDDDLDEFILI